MYGQYIHNLSLYPNILMDFHGTYAHVKGWVKIHQADFFLSQDSLSNKEDNKILKRLFVQN